MAYIRAILKEIGGRGLDAAGSIKSRYNMFEGSHGNAPSDKLVGSDGTDNPSETENPDKTEEENESQSDINTEDLQMSSSGDSVDTDTETSDANAKTDIKSISFQYRPYEGGRIRGIFKNEDFNIDPKIKGPSGSGGGAGMGGSEGGEAADGADAADAADAADGADAMG